MKAKQPAPSPYRQEQEAWDRLLWAETGQAIGRWLIEAGIRTNRPVVSLTAIELEGMAWAAVWKYIDMRYRRARELDAGVVLTEMEREAVRAARQAFHDALVKIGVVSAFDQCTAEQVDHVIESVWAGLRARMALLSAKGEIPV